MALAIYFASSGIESLRIGLNRAYGAEREPRSWWLLRLESIAYVLVAAVALLVLAFLVVLAPLIFATAVRYAPLARTAVAACSTSCASRSPAVVLIVALVIAHKWLPAGRRPLLDDRARHRRDAGAVAARRRTCSATTWRDFAYTYVTYYAGLASAMIALVFLYVIASIFIYGGELNAAIAALARRQGARPVAGRG